MSGPLPDFDGVWRPGGVGRPAELVPVMRPFRLRNKGFMLVGCRAFTWNGVQYDMYVIRRQRGGGWKVLNFVTQGERDMAAVNYGRDRFYVHRLVAYNTRCAPRTRQPWWNPLSRPWPRTRTEVHHHHRTMHAPPREPWRCSMRLAMVVWLKDEHREWHRLHPGVDWPF